MDFRTSHPSGMNRPQGFQVFHPSRMDSSTLWTWIICPFYGLQNISSSWDEPLILLDFVIDPSTYWTNIFILLGWTVHKDFSYFILHGWIRLVCGLNNISSFLDEFVHFMDLIKFCRKNTSHIWILLLLYSHSFVG